MLTHKEKADAFTKQLSLLLEELARNDIGPTTRDLLYMEISELASDVLCCTSWTPFKCYDGKITNCLILLDGKETLAIHCNVSQDGVDEVSWHVGGVSTVTSQAIAIEADTYSKVLSFARIILNDKIRQHYNQDLES